MSKAFTREGEGDALDDLPPVDEWPAGVKNYLTPAGHAALKAEIDRLRALPRGDGRAKLAIEQRLAALLGRLEAAEVIDPTAQPADDRARFGATVTVEDDDGETRRYRIVGVDEADPKRGQVSWRSPIARALVGRSIGDITTLHTPAGDQELTIVKIELEASRAEEEEEEN
ncbi:MAG: gramicidin synthase [Myxococcales bacterium]|nr:gramicidin synthase [Myxococcales bacterium]